MLRGTDQPARSSAYQLAREREVSRLAIPVDDPPKYSEAFPFVAIDWVPGTTQRIANEEKVSAEVADLVAKLYRSMRAHRLGRARYVIWFRLQCVTAMFTENFRSSVGRPCDGTAQAQARRMLSYLSKVK